jgi:hypothetical protein
MVGLFVFMQENDTAKMMTATGGVDSGGGGGGNSSSSSFLNEIRTFIQNCEELYQRLDLNCTTLYLVLKFMIRVCYHDRNAYLYLYKNICITIWVER